MSKRVILVGMLGVLGASTAACEIVGGLQRATLSETGGGGQGGTGTTSAGGTTSTGGTTTASICEPGKTIVCYSGPADSKGKGICHDGSAACKTDGSGYEACEGDQTPKSETCVNVDDEDCDGHDCARWARVFGDGGEQIPSGVGADAEGNAYVLGTFTGALPVVNPALVSSGMKDLFLVKVSPLGEILWVRQFGDAADQPGGAIAVDATGNVAIAASFDGTVDFGKGDLGPGGTAIVKLDAQGNTLWSNWYPTKLSGHVAINKDADVIFWTTFAGKIDLGTGQLDAGMLTDIALAKFAAATGTTAWAKQLGYSGQHDNANGLAIDGGNNIVVSGDYSQTINLGGGDLMKTNADFSELFVGRFDKNGAYAAGKSYPKLATGTSMVLDSLGSALIADVVEVGQDQYSSTLQKIDNMVAEVWTKTYSASLESIAVDSQDNVSLALIADGNIDFGAGALMPIGSKDIVLAKLDASGAHRWSRRFGSTGEIQWAPHLAAAPDGDVIMAAAVSGTIDVGTGPLPTNGLDLLIARFAP